MFAGHFIRLDNEKNIVKSASDGNLEAGGCEEKGKIGKYAINRGVCV
jgi:hypothetical protein